MPHRPDGHGGGSGTSSDSNLYTPPRVPGAAAAAIMRQSSANSQAVAAAMYGAARSAAGVVTPLVGSKPWMTGSNVRHHHAHHLPGLEFRNKSTDSTDRSMGNSSQDDSRSVATLATEDDREATASALLMVAKAAEREHFNNIIHAAQMEAERSSNGTRATGGGASPAMPLKKRLRRQQEEDDASIADSTTTNAEKETTSSVATPGQDPCHVSPVSHSSAEHGTVGGRTESTEDSTPTRRIVPHGSANRTSSYDSKDLPPSYRGESKQESTQELLDSAKVHNTAQIGVPPAFPSQVLIPHFPTVLHQVLADKEFDGKVVQWLPDGEAWKVLRWDALRRQILPRYFSDLRDENGSGCGTIDAFLFHLGAWGFEEIKDGTDVGAYKHDLFIRGAQKLCVKMRFRGDAVEDTNKGPKTVSPARPPRHGDSERSMLQVPSLGSMEMGDSKIPPSKRPRYDGPSSVHSALHWAYTESPAAWGGQYPSDAPHLYGLRAAAAAMAGQYPSGPSFGDPRIPLRRTSTPEPMPRQPPASHQYSPPQVRSGRGAMRVAAAGNRGSAASSPTTTPVVRQGISVSNRGKGPRKPAACRSAVPASSDSKREGSASPSNVAERVSPQTVSAAAALSEAQRIGSSVQGVAVAISRKTKRKLPMAAKKTESTTAAVSSPSSSAIGEKKRNVDGDSTAGTSAEATKAEEVSSN